MGENQKEQYCALISEIVQKQAIILGPDIAILVARRVPGLTVSDDGKTISINGGAEEALQKIVNEYVELSGLIVKNTLGSIFAKYPALKLQ